MIAAVVLVVALIRPGLPAEVEHFPMPSVELCKEAMADFLKPPISAEEVPPPDYGRAAWCVWANAQGVDS